jgi:hypothetical protein
VLDFLKLSEMQTEQYSAKQFSRDVDANIRKYEDESEVLRHVNPLLGRLLRTPGSVRPRLLQDFRENPSLDGANRRDERTLSNCLDFFEN